MKKLFSIILSVLMVFTISTAASAASDSHTYVSEAGTKITTTETPAQLIVRVEFDDHVEIARRDKNSSIITTQIYDSNGNLIKTTQVNTAAMPADFYQHTISKYEYDVDTSGTYEQWTCTRRDDSITLTNLKDGGLTATRLDLWKVYVDDINDYENL